MPTVSVIVSTKNSARTLDACLESVRLQDLPDIELVVVDNHSTDATPEIAKRYADAFIVAGPERCAQRNIGLSVALGKYVLVIDSDMRLERNVVTECVRVAERGAEAVAIPEKSFGQGFWSACKAFEKTFYKNDRTVSAARFFPRDLVLRLGGYDEKLNATEDWDLSIRAVGTGELAFADAVIHHDEGRQNIKSLFLKKLYYGKYFVAFLKKHGKEGLRRMGPGRAALFADPQRLRRHPRLAAGLFAVKLVEVSGGMLGLIAGSLVRGEVIYKQR